MAINTKAIKTRIGSVKNTKKITRAMQMIAAVKMRKAVQSAVNTRHYAILSNELLQNLAKSHVSHPLTKKREVKKGLLVLITSNKGLCGNYNNAVLKEAQKIINKNSKEKDSIEYSVIAVGQKSANFARRNNLKLLELYEKLTDSPKIEDTYVISKELMKAYESKEYDQVVVIYTNYISGLSQKPVVKQLLPLTSESVIEMIDELNTVTTDIDTTMNAEEYKSEINDEYEFEPKKKQIVNYVIPMLVEIQLYQSILESAASEHSSRMIAMKNASESASDMIDSLTLEFNKGRQAAITQEISEIVSGASAL